MYAFFRKLVHSCFSSKKLMHIFHKHTHFFAPKIVCKVEKSVGERGANNLYTDCTQVLYLNDYTGIIIVTIFIGLKLF